MTGPQISSQHGRIAALEIGEVAWIEAPLDKLVGIQRRISNVTHRLEAMTPMRFKTRTYTAVGSVGLGDVVYLIRVEKTI